MADPGVVHASLASELWGIWCVELHAWCRNIDGKPDTYTFQSIAQLKAFDWREENAWQAAHGVWDRFANRRIMLWTYEVRPYVPLGQA
jgi:hypothetical protein